MDAEFRVGPWLVQPSLNVVAQNDTAVRLEPKVMEVLVCLAHRAGEPVSKEELIQAVWPDTFVTDDVLKRCISELRRVFDDDAREPHVIETIPKRGYRMIAAVEPVSEGPAAIPRGLPDREDVSEGTRGKEARPAGVWSSARGHWQLVIGTILLVVVVVVGVVSLNLRGRESSIDSIAVMPFACKATDTGTELADGLTSGLIESLSQIPQLRVMSRSSVTRYKGQDVDLRKVGHELNVRAVLTGTLTPRGDGFVLDAELVNTSDNSHLWGQQYTTNPDDVLTLQANLVREVSTKLRPSLTPESKARLASPGTSNSEAYALYVKGRYAFDRWEPQHVKEALVFFEQAVERDPTYAQAYAGIGDAYAILTFYASFSFEEGIRNAKAAAQKALELDANLAEGHCALGLAAYIHYEWQLAESETRRCVELNPNLLFAHQWLAFVLESQGKMEQGLAEQKLALELDPISFMGNKFLGLTFFFLRDYDRAIEQLRRMTELEPNQPNLRDRLADSYAMKGEYDKVALEYQEELRIEGKPDQAEALRRAYAKHGYRGLLKAQIEFWSDPQKPDDYDPYDVAANYSLLGDRENAFLWLDRAYATRYTSSSAMLPIQIDPLLDNIRSDPRYKAFLLRMGFPSSVSIQPEIANNSR